jgi:hypothetical protein
MNSLFVLLLLFLKWAVIRSKPEHTGYPYYPRHFYIYQIVHNAHCIENKNNAFIFN